MLSGSTDGLVNIYNIAIPDEEEALIQIINHDSSIHYAAFLSSKEFYALSHDEILSVYQLTNPDETIVNRVPSKLGDLRSALNCDYIIDIVPSGNGQAVIGTGIHRYALFYRVDSALMCWSMILTVQPCSALKN